MNSNQDLPNIRTTMNSIPSGVDVTDNLEYVEICHGVSPTDAPSTDGGIGIFVIEEDEHVLDVISAVSRDRFES